MDRRTFWLSVLASAMAASTPAFAGEKVFQDLTPINIV
jgi:hypothetical protein